MTYVVVELMLQQGWIMMSSTELDEYLDEFEKKGLITTTERELLLELTRMIKVDDSTQ
jgi:hypothetical protein